MRVRLAICRHTQWVVSTPAGKPPVLTRQKSPLMGFDGWKHRFLWAKNGGFTGETAQISRVYSGINLVAGLMDDGRFSHHIILKPNLVNNPETSSILSSTQICFSAFGASSIQFQVCCLSLTWNILVGPWEEHFCYNFLRSKCFFVRASIYTWKFDS